MDRIHHRRSALAAATLFSLTAVGLATPQAEAAPPGESGAWKPIANLSRGQDFVESVDIAVTPAGDTIAAWATQNPFSVVYAAVRPAGDTWSAPVLVSAKDDFADDVSLDVDGQGNATVVWGGFTFNGLKSVIRASELAPGGTWSEPRDLPGDTDATDTSSLNLDVAPTGAAAATWVDADAVLAAYRPAGGAWAEPDIVTQNVTVTSNPVVATSATGVMTVLWVDPHDQVVRARTRAPDGSWSGVHDLGTDEGTSSAPQVVARSGGGFLAAWQQFTQLGRSSLSRISSAAQTPAGSWLPAEAVTNASVVSAFHPRIAVNAAGDAVATWSDADDFDLWGSFRAVNGGWGPRQHIGGNASGPVTLDSDGRAMAFFEDGDVLKASRSHRGAPWSEPETISDPDASSDPDFLAAVVDSDGDVAAAWIEESDTAVASTRTFDGGAPLMSGLLAPSQGSPGQPLAYAASATDHWSPVASYSWSFGDGTSATGAAVTHAYAAPGIYAVTLTVTDRVGNSSTSTATTTVTATAAPPPPPALQAPVITVFKLTDPKIHALARAAAEAPDKTKLKIRLSTAAKVRLVVKSKHQHRVHGTTKRIKVVLTRRLPTGTGVVTLRARLATIKLPADTYTVTGTATNTSGTSPQKKVRLRVVMP